MAFGLTMVSQRKTHIKDSSDGAKLQEPTTFKSYESLWEHEFKDKDKAGSARAIIAENTTLVDVRAISSEMGAETRILETSHLSPHT